MLSFQSTGSVSINIHLMFKQTGEKFPNGALGILMDFCLIWQVVSKSTVSRQKNLQQCVIRRCNVATKYGSFKVCAIRLIKTILDDFRHLRCDCYLLPFDGSFRLDCSLIVVVNFWLSIYLFVCVLIGDCLPRNSDEFQSSDSGPKMEHPCGNQCFLHGSCDFRLETEVLKPISPFFARILNRIPYRPLCSELISNRIFDGICSDFNSDMFGQNLRQNCTLVVDSSVVIDTIADWLSFWLSIGSRLSELRQVRLRTHASTVYKPFTVTTVM